MGTSGNRFRSARCPTWRDAKTPTSTTSHAVSEIVVRSSGQPAGERALEVGFLGLERTRLEGAIKQAGEAEDFDLQRELSSRRTEITERIVRLMSEEDDFSAEQQVSSSQETRDSAADDQ